MGYSTLSTVVGKAPPVAKGVTADRILNARSESKRRCRSLDDGHRSLRIERH